MKKITFILLLVLLVPLLTIGCTIKLGNYSINGFHIIKKKPIVSYYTENLAKKLLSDPSLKIVMLDMNFYKEKELSKEDMDIVKNFFSSLKKNNFIEKSKDFPNKPQFKIFISSKDEKYVINIFDATYISVYPWDGNYSMDYINMEGIQPINNLFSLCRYIITNSTGL